MEVLIRRLNGPESRLAFALLLGAVLLLTLVPAFQTAEDIPILCLLCGTEGTADFVLNLLLFLPVGFLAFRHLPTRAVAIVAVVLFPLVIESLQIMIPGRYPTLGDVIANSLGGLVGVGAAAFLARRPQPGVLATIAALLPSLLVTASLPATLYFLKPDYPDAAYYGQWTADLGYLSVYPGTLHEARVGFVPLPSRRLNPEAVNAIRAISSGSPLTVTFTAGVAPTDLAPIFSVFDGQQSEILLLGARNDALVVHIRRRAREFRFRAPALHFDGMHPSSGQRVTVNAWQSNGGVCVRLINATRCLPLATPGRTWSLLLGNLPAAIPALMLDGLWLALLGFIAVITASLSFRPPVSRGTYSVGVVLPYVTYGGLWLLSANPVGWLPGLVGLVLGGATALRVSQASTATRRP